MFFRSFFLCFILGLLFLSIPSVFARTVLPNELGRIPVMEYHDIGDKEASFVRSRENFRKDLEFFYLNDYQLITVQDFLRGEFDLTAGKKPLIFTFDDSRESQFSILPDGSVDPQSAVGIMDAFYQAHPDFGRASIFYVLQYPFGQPEFFQKKLRYLLDTDREIGNHTLDHDSLAKFSVDDIQRTLAGLQGRISELLGEPIALQSLAYPYGAVPKGDDFVYVGRGSFGDVDYEITSAFLVGADPTYPPYYVSFDPLKIPRIQADDAEFQRWFNRTSGEIARVTETFKPFISDGDKNVISVLEKDLSKVKSDGRTIRVATEVEVAEPSEPSVMDVQVVPLAPQGDLPTGVFDPTLREFFFQAKVFIHDLFLSFNHFIQNIEIRELPAELERNEDGFVYMVQEGDTLGSIAIKFLPFTSYYLKQELVAELETNGKSLQVGQTIRIPDVELVVINSAPLIREKKGIYWTGYTAGSSRALELLDSLEKYRGNMVIFDLKETAGEIFYDTQVPLAQEIGAISLRIPDVKKLVRVLHRRGIYAVARLTVFKDAQLAKMKPEYALHRRSNGQVHNEGEVAEWLDPSHPGAQDYNIELAKEVAKLGVDEIQFDYIRFPTLGYNPDVLYYFQKEEPGKQKHEVIAEFLSRARKELQPYGVKLSIDVFGIIAWNEQSDIDATGQSISVLADYVDAVYPMVYPSHFGPGFGGHKNPADEPYFFIQDSVKKFQSLIGERAEIIPWIQGFPYRVTNFNTQYLREQIRALEDLGVPSFAVWSAANRYDVSLPAFP